MIYDFQDVGTKYYLAFRVRDWVNTENNALILLQNPKVKELTDADLSVNSDDDIVWTVLYLIGVGLLRYSVTPSNRHFNIGLNLNWRKPEWLFDSKSKALLNNHVDYMMELEQEGRVSGMPPTGLVASLDIIKYRNFRLLEPNEVVKDNLTHETMLIAINKSRLRAKHIFHRGR